MTSALSLPFGGKKHSFRLGLEQLEELQKLCDAGPATVFARLVSGQSQAGKKPIPENYPGGAADEDFQRDANLHVVLRNIGGDWRVADVRETIRLGLIGGGMTPSDAYALVYSYVEQTHKYPLVDNVGIAGAILHHALTAPEGEPLGKPETGKTTAEATA